MRNTLGNRRNRFRIFEDLHSKILVLHPSHHSMPIAYDASTGLATRVAARPRSRQDRCTPTSVMQMDISRSLLAAQEKACALLAAQDNAVVPSRSTTQTPTDSTEQQSPPASSPTVFVGVAVASRIRTSAESPKSLLLERSRARLAAADPAFADLDNWRADCVTAERLRARRAGAQLVSSRLNRLVPASPASRSLDLLEVPPRLPQDERRRRWRLA